MNDDGLERLKKRLYKEGERFGGRFREPELSYKPEKVDSGWPERQSEEILAEVLKEPKLLKMKFLLWAGIIFVLGVIVLASFYLFGGFGAVSSRNIDLVISAPQEVAGGDLVRWEVSVTNKNNVKFASADLGFKYPEGSRPVNVIPGSFLIERVSLGEISAGDTVRRTFAAHVFGPENFEAEAEAVLEYRTEGSNAVFEKSGKKNIKIIRSPVGVSFNAAGEINAGREINFEVKYVSNSSETIRGLALDLTYPSGFIFKNSSLQPAEGENRWVLGDLAPGSERSVSISGVFEGEDMEQKNITAQIGVLDGKSLSVYGASTHSFTIRRMFVDLNARINGRDDITAVKSGDLVNVNIFWKNNLLQSVRDVNVEIEVLGEVLDEKTISVFSGAYRGFEKKVVWSPSSLSDLSLLDPGGSGQSSFSFRVLDAVSLSRAKLVNPTIKLKGEIRPASSPAGLGEFDVSGKFELELKIETSLQLSSRGVYYSAVLPGRGPLPPRVGEETVYTVIWTLANVSNNASGVAVKASVPAYVAWKGAVLPSAESVVYDPARLEIIWRPGAIKAGVGITQPAREVMFQLGIIPSVDQTGSSPVLLFDISASGRDDFTGNSVSDAASSLTTDILASDTKTKSGDENVAR